MSCDLCGKKIWFWEYPVWGKSGDVAGDFYESHAACDLVYKAAFVEGALQAQASDDRLCRSYGYPTPSELRKIELEDYVEERDDLRECSVEGGKKKQRQRGTETPDEKRKSDYEKAMKIAYETSPERTEAYKAAMKIAYETSPERTEAYKIAIQTAYGYVLKPKPRKIARRTPKVV